METVFGYGAANRLTKIDHQNPLAMPILTYTYSCLDNGLVSQITDYNPTDGTTDTFFSYDDRGRLVYEFRNPANAYHIDYVYDQGGNRTSKTFLTSLDETRVDYVYDISDPAYGSANNRLMSYETWDISGPTDVLLSETYYYYNCDGNVTNVVTKNN